LSKQTPNGTAYVIGNSGLINALYNVGYIENDVNPEYVVVGETNNLSFNEISRAVYHVNNGARLIGTNKDIMDRVGTGVAPSTGTFVAPIELMTNKKAYFIGKPNPLIMTEAMKILGTNTNETVIIGDRMDTDIVAGTELGIDTVLLLSGVTKKEDIRHWPFKPQIILDTVGELVPEEFVTDEKK